MLIFEMKGKCAQHLRDRFARLNRLVSIRGSYCHILVAMELGKVAAIRTCSILMHKSAYPANASVLHRIWYG
jgi:hypothetical protein